MLLTCLWAHLSNKIAQPVSFLVRIIITGVLAIYASAGCISANDLARPADLRHSHRQTTKSGSRAAALSDCRGPTCCTSLRGRRPHMPGQRHNNPILAAKRPSSSLSGRFLRYLLVPRPLSRGRGEGFSSTRSRMIYDLSCGSSAAQHTIQGHPRQTF